MRLKKDQRLAVIRWIAEGLQSDEINGLASKFEPPFSLSRATIAQYRRTRRIDINAIIAEGQLEAHRGAVERLKKRLETAAVGAADVPALEALEKALGKEGLADAFIELNKNSEYELWTVGPIEPIGFSGVKSLGMVSYLNLPKIYQQCHCLVLPTVEDGIAMVIQEAMSSGVVPICTADPAEVFEHGKSGFEVDYHNVDQIIGAIKYLHDFPGKRFMMSGEARALAEKQTWTRTREWIKKVIDGFEIKEKPYIF